MFDLNEVKIKMEKSIESLDNRFTTVRAGRANPNILTGFMVEYYGTPTPIQSLATISIPEARELLIKPFDKSMLKDLERALYAADLGMSPTNTGEALILTVPELTEETRRTYVKQVKEMAEEAKISLRNIRQEANNTVKKLEISEDIKEDYQNDIQELINKYNKIVDEHLKEKEQELMTV